MKRTLLFACLLACASLIFPTSGEAGIFGNTDFRCRFQRMKERSRGFMDRWKKDTCCDSAIETDATTDDEMAPAPTPAEGDAPPAPPAEEAAPEPAADANA
ncbi:MAG: hypothetical protein O2955_04335 [Planctomycetota bacterium]|nr:hypothetical protein [Planctomycetota bacterium]MDA1211718.1 hypothetical protein [Planctomycetota bacterium]